MNRGSGSSGAGAAAGVAAGAAAAGQRAKRAKKQKHWFVKYQISLSQHTDINAWTHPPLTVAARVLRVPQATRAPALPS